MNASLFVLPSFSSFSPRVEKIDSFFSSSALLRTYSRKGACWFKISCHSAPKSTFVVSPSSDVVVKVVVLIVSVFTFVGVVFHDDDCDAVVVTDDDWSRCCSRRRSVRSRREPSGFLGFFSRKTSSPLLNALLRRGFGSVADVPGGNGCFFSAFDGALCCWWWYWWCSFLVVSSIHPLSLVLVFVVTFSLVSVSWCNRFLMNSFFFSRLCCCCHLSCATATT